jgi:hypothetical protein
MATCSPDRWLFMTFCQDRTRLTGPLKHFQLQALPAWEVPLLLKLLAQVPPAGFDWEIAKATPIKRAELIWMTL